MTLFVLAHHTLTYHLNGATLVNYLECSNTLLQGSPEFPACFECDGRLAQMINKRISLSVCLFLLSLS